MIAVSPLIDALEWIKANWNDADTYGPAGVVAALWALATWWRARVTRGKKS